MSKISVHREMPEAAKPLVGEESKRAESSSFQPWVPIELTLPDGRKIVMQEPRLVTRLQNQIMKDTTFEDSRLLIAELATVQALLFIHSIDGEVIDKPHDELTRDALEQRIGARNMGLVVRAFRANFPDFGEEELKVTKKL